MKCRFPGCNNEPTRWSRRAFCGEHRGAARSYSHAVTNRVPVETPPLSEKLRRFHALKDSIQSTFPDAGKPFARNPAGYEVMILAPGGLRA
jgi:hypothetical protein